MSTNDLFLQAISTLAKIDEELGLPPDGCNNPQQTLNAIKLLHAAHRDDCQRIAEVEAESARTNQILRRAVGQIEGFIRAGWLVTGASVEEARDLISTARLVLNVAESQ